MDKATRDSTKVKYKSIINKWTTYCTNNNINTVATTETFLNFLAEEFVGRNLSFPYIRSYTAALGSYIQHVEKHKLTQLLKGMHNTRPPQAKYCKIWDVNVVLTFVSAMRTDTPMLLSQKVSTLLMILSGNRVNMLTHMRIDHMVLGDDECTFTFKDPLKHTRPGARPDIMTFRAYEEKSLCPVEAIKEYVEHRAPLCPDSNLFITTVQPFHKAHHDTIARWIKTVLCSAGINTQKYQAHSCRAASTSTAALAGVAMNTIIKSASWANVGTFKRFYQREIETHYEPEKENFGQKTLQQYSDSL